MKEEALDTLMKIYGSTKQQCTHPAFDANLCVICRKALNKCDNSATLVPFRYINRNFLITPRAVFQLRDVNSQILLLKKKLHLVLDLDNTLIQATKKQKKNNKSTNDDDIYEILKGDMLVKLRPGARHFLSEAAQLFDLSIYTMADEPYARQVAKILESDKVKFSRVISRDDCTKMSRKSLDIVLSDPRVVLIVDDIAQIWDSVDRGNVIKIKPYTFFPKAVDEDDRELERVLTVLKTVHSKFFDNKKQATKDVRQLLLQITVTL